MSLDVSASYFMHDITLSYSNIILMIIIVLYIYFLLTWILFSLFQGFFSLMI